MPGKNSKMRRRRMRRARMRSALRTEEKSVATVNALRPYLAAFAKKSGAGPMKVLVEDEKGRLVPAEREDPAGDLRLLRGLFKADFPYRSRLGLSGTLATNSAGALNVAFNVSAITGITEFSSFSNLFDELFIHSLTIRFIPRNVLGAGVGSGAQTTNTVAPMDTAGTASNAQIANAAIIMACLFNGAPVYSTGSAMVENATHRVVNSGEPFTYVWRNNVKFDPHGLAISSATTESYQGWTLCSNATNYGGTIQLRQLTDTAFGDALHTITLGETTTLFDVSFRARA